MWRLLFGAKVSSIMAWKLGSWFHAGATLADLESERQKSMENE